MSAVGSDRSGDPYLPEHGNGGYRVRHYDVDVAYDPGSRELVGHTVVRLSPLATRLLDLCAGWTDVGLLAEEYDPRVGRQVGNFPQAFTHVGLVNSASNLASAEAGPARQRAETHPHG